VVRGQKQEEVLRCRPNVTHDRLNARLGDVAAEVQVEADPERGDAQMEKGALPAGTDQGFACKEQGGDEKRLHREEPERDNGEIAKVCEYSVATLPLRAFNAVESRNRESDEQQNCRGEYVDEWVGEGIRVRWTQPERAGEHDRKRCMLGLGSGATIEPSRQDRQGAKGCDRRREHVCVQESQGAIGKCHSAYQTTLATT
jgi:hypothetical protein